MRRQRIAAGGNQMALTLENFRITLMLDIAMRTCQQHESVEIVRRQSVDEGQEIRVDRLLPRANMT